MSQYSLPLNLKLETDDEEDSSNIPAFSLLTKKQKRLIDTSVEIQTTNAYEVDQVGFGAKCMVAACLPYRNPKPDQLVNGCWTRANGNYSLWVQGGDEGIPYGSYPRLFTIWLTSEATRTDSRYISLGGSFRSFCNKLDIDSSYGKNGAGRRLIQQVNRFLSSRISFTKVEVDVKHGITKTGRVFIPFSDKYQLIWGQEHEGAAILKEANIVLSEAFFTEITTHHIPIDMRAIARLKQSSQALDIYQWLAYRNYLLNNNAKKRATITWEQLNAQFGANYRCLRQFKAEFLKTLRLVHVVYPEAKIEEAPDKLVLYASPTPVSPR